MRNINRTRLFLKNIKQNIKKSIEKYIIMLYSVESIKLILVITVSNAIDFQNYLNRQTEKINKLREGKTFDDFRVGDTVEIVYRLMQDEKVLPGEEVEWRTQTLVALCIGKRNNSFSSTFTVRKIVDQSSSFDRVFMYYSPMIQSIKLVKTGKVRRAKLNYLDKVYGKSARIKERKIK